MHSPVLSAYRRRQLQYNRYHHTSFTGGRLVTDWWLRPAVPTMAAVFKSDVSRPRFSPRLSQFPGKFVKRQLMQPEFLLQIWRDACLSHDLATAADAVVRALAPQMPLQTLLVRSLDQAHRTVRTLAIAHHETSGYPHQPDQASSEAKWARLNQWAASQSVLSCPAHRRSGDARLLVPVEIEGEVLAGPLFDAHGPIGALVLSAPLNRSFQPHHRQWLEQLLAPFSVALEKHLGHAELTLLRESADAEKQYLLKRLGKSESTGEVIVGADTGLRLIMDRVKLVANSDVPVLILGETGTGKEVVSRAIHQRSRRASGPFIRVNCGAIPAELLDSHLFGHERGSFTGADALRQGWFERADGGTLFLDEIGELPPAAQVRLLRVLQDSFVERVGGQNPIRVDVRIITATHRDLQAMVRDNSFREDLWYRINVFPLLMPPLRDRPEDIGTLVRHFARRAADRFGLPPTEPTPDDLLLLLQYHWPGNIRELAAVVDRAVILGEGQRLDLAKALGIHAEPAEAWNSSATDPAAAGRSAAATTAVGPAADEATFYEVIPEGRRSLMPPAAAPAVPASTATVTDASSLAADGCEAPPPLTLDQLMRQHIESVLRSTEGRVEGKDGAAELLGINPHTLRGRMRKLGVQWSDYRS